jgi:hypothetical protein
MVEYYNKYCTFRNTQYLETNWRFAVRHFNSKGFKKYKIVCKIKHHAMQI